MNTLTGSIKKMRVELAEPVNYFFRVSDNNDSEQEIYFNALLNKKITLNFLGEIFCIQCGRRTKTSFQQGYCFPCLRHLQECDLCVIHPERCHVETHGCPMDHWAHQHCHQTHIVYLANSSALKVGITRYNQVPTRWIDQGATQALPIMQTSNRYQAGLIEVIMKSYVADKTNWRLMLQQDNHFIDLLAEKKPIFQQAQKQLEWLRNQYHLEAIRIIDNSVPVKITYPVLEYPKKIKTWSFEKESRVEGVLLGIKGQYILLDTGVMNIRKYAGYRIQLTWG